MAPSVEKKIVELEMGLLHLQQNIDIPDVSLGIHPVITTMIRKCEDEGRKPKVIDFADKAEDSTFLNTLQTGVGRWIREIQKVNQWQNRDDTWNSAQQVGTNLKMFSFL